MLKDKMEMLPKHTVSIMNEMIEKIYKTNSIREMREKFLEQIALLISYDCAMFDLAKTESPNNPSFFDPVTANMSSDFVESYFRHYQKIDYTSWIFSQSHSGVYRDTDVVADSMRERTEIFTDWMRPLGVYYGSGASIIQNGILLGSVTLFRSKASGDFTEDEMFVLEMLNRHLANKLFQTFPHGIQNGFHINRQERFFAYYELTDREQEVARLMLDGQGNKEIAAHLYIAESTVKKHVAHIFQKLNIKNRMQLVKIFMHD